MYYVYKWNCLLEKILNYRRSLQMAIEKVNLCSTVKLCFGMDRIEQNSWTSLSIYYCEVDTIK